MKYIKNIWAIAFFLLLSFWLYSDYHQKHSIKSIPVPELKTSNFAIDTVYTKDSAFVVTTLIDSSFKPIEEHEPMERN